MTDKQVFPFGLKTYEMHFLECMNDVSQQFKEEVMDRQIDPHYPTIEQANWMRQRYADLFRGLFFDQVKVVMGMPNIDADTQLQIIAILWQSILGAIEPSMAWRTAAETRIQVLKGGR